MSTKKPKSTPEQPKPRHLDWRICTDTRGAISIYADCLDTGFQIESTGEDSDEGLRAVLWTRDGGCLEIMQSDDIMILTMMCEEIAQDFHVLPRCDKASEPTALRFPTGPERQLDATV